MNKVFYQHVFSLVITGVYGGIRACGKQRDGCSDPEEDQDVI